MSEPAGSLKSWLGGQMPSVQKKVKAIRLEDDEVLLHVGPSKIRSFYPRVPGSVASGEDTTVGRVCCSLSLSKALWGGRHHFPSERLYLYAFEERNVLVPSTSLTQEGKRGNEVWIVPHRMENWDITPQRVGEARIISKSSPDDVLEYQLHYVVKIDNMDIPYDDDTLLKAGHFYEFVVERGAKWKAIDGGQDIVVDEEFRIKFVGETHRDYWDRAALEYVVSLR